MSALNIIHNDTDREPRSGKRLLIVDDEAGVREVLKCVLGYGLSGCRIDVAGNGEEAVSSFIDAHHDVVIMDLKMPIMDGETAFERIRELCGSNHWNMPAVVFLTGYEPSKRIETLIEHDHTHCLLFKPITNSVLLETVNERLGA